MAALALTLLWTPIAFAQDTTETPTDTPAADDGWGDEGATDDDIAAFETEQTSFGSALDILGLSVSWSGYGDLNFRYVGGQPAVGTVGDADYLDPVASKATWDAYHFNPIMGARLSDKAWTELELEIEHGGELIKIEYALLDYTINDYATVRLGKQLVPIGLYNDVIHPSFRWTQANRPLMMANVIPGVWADVGGQVFGKVPIGGSELAYAGYVLNGLGAGTFEGETYAFHDAFAGSESIRTTRDNTRDKNLDKGVGGRLAFTAAKGAPVGETLISVSGYTGDLDKDTISNGAVLRSNVRFSVAAVALQTKLGPFRLIAEGAQNFLGDEFNTTGLGVRSSSWTYENGFYVYPHLKFGKSVTGARYDRVSTGPRTNLDDLANPKPGGVLSDVAISTKYDVSTFWNLRGELLLPFKTVTDGQAAARANPPELQIVSAFYW